MPENETITLIVPVFNESLQVNNFLKKVNKELTDKNFNWTVLFVDDGSIDSTAEVILSFKSKGWPVQLIILSRNFGKEAALTAGLDYAEGKAVVPIDVDLQHPPELIPEMVKVWQNGADIVLAQRYKREGESFFKKYSAKFYYLLLNQFSEINLPPNVGDFRLLDRKVVLVLRNMPERTRYMKGLFSWPGFHSETVFYNQKGRDSGENRQTFGKLFRLAIDGIISFSSFPLRIWSLIGGIAAFFALTYMFWIIISTILLGRDVPGYASIMTTILFVGGLQLFSVGVLGEYLAKVFTEVKRRPVYVIKNFKDEK